MERLIEEGYSQKEIIDVLVYPDEVPETITGVYRVGGVEITYADNSMNYCKELVDNKEYSSEEEMLTEISKRLNVNSEIIRLA